MRAKHIAALGAIAALAAGGIAAQGGSAQAPGSTTLTFYSPDAGSTFKIIDNAPKSPVKNPESPKYRFSIGDQLIVSAPLLDKKGGTRQGKAYVAVTVVGGRTFRDISAEATGTYVLTDKSQIDVVGFFNFSSSGTRLPIVGGTGRYEGVRGSVSSVNDENDNSSTDTLTLLP